MTLNKLPGVYFGEVVNTIASDTDIDEVLTFIVQTSVEIPTLDDKLTLFESVADFKTVVAGKGLSKTVEFIDDMLSMTGHVEFYIYSVKQDTGEGYTNSIISSMHLKENKKHIYLEERPSTQANTIANKIDALGAACETCATNGAFRVAYVIPLATINAAVAGAENITAEEAAVTEFTNILTGAGHGRVDIFMPDGYSSMAATCVDVPYYTDPGYPQVLGTVGTLKFNFNTEQMVTLQNLGVNFIRPERIAGEYIYRINLGVTGSFKSDAADGLICSRETADELLRRVDRAVLPFIKDKESSSNVTFIQAAVNEVIADFVNEGSVIASGTQLTVSDAGNMRFAINGKITTVKSVVAIDVNTTLY